MQRWLRLASVIDGFNERIGRVIYWLTLVMVGVGSYNALVRYVSGWVQLEPETAGWFDTLRIFIGPVHIFIGTIRIFIGEVALRLSSNMFIELQWYLFSLVFLLGAAYTLKHNAHVRVDVLYTRLSARGKAWINLLGTVLFLIPFCVLMLWTSWPVIEDSWARLEGSPDPGGLPRYPLLTAIPLAFILLILQGGAFLIQQIATLRGLTPSGAAAEEVGHV